MSSFSTNTSIVKADLVDHVLYFALRWEEAEAATHPLHGLQGDLLPQLLPGSCPAPRLQLHQAEVVLQLSVQLPILLLQQAGQYGSLLTPALVSQGVLHTASKYLRDSVTRCISTWLILFARWCFSKFFSRTQRKMCVNKNFVLYSKISALGSLARVTWHKTKFIKSINAYYKCKVLI